MSLRDRLTKQLKAFDEEAFVALANRGLLRRAQKDLEKLAPEIAEENVERVVVQLAGQRISFDARGPSHATCSCPASGVCQHVLAAALWLQLSSEGAAAAAKEAQGAAEEAVPSLQVLHEALLGIGNEALVKHAGTPGYRWAWQYVEDLGEEGVEFSGANYIVISFKQPRVRLRYLGGGLDSILADSEVKHLDKYQIAAALAYQRAHGIQLTPPEPRKKGRTSQLDLGKEHELPDDAGIANDESRGRLRASIRQIVRESVEVGLSHLSASVQERFATLAVWSHGAGYYRLALLLRRLADHVELLLDRAAGADEQRLFDELTIAFGLVAALESEEAKGNVPARLLGRARSTYETTDDLEVLGLGASAWRSPAGYVGLTMLFYSPKERVFYSCTEARPEVQRGFDPRARYRTPGPWGGLGAPEQATGRRVSLSRPAINAQGRLSGSEDTLAAVQPDAAMFEHLTGCKSWSELRQLTAAQRSVLAEAQPMLDWVLLQPARCGKCHFDSASQTLIWPVYDEEDRELVLEVVYSEFNDHAIHRIEQLSRSTLPDDALIVAKLRGSSRLVAEPLSIVCRGSERPVDALHFDDAPKQGLPGKWLAKALTSAHPTPATPQPAPVRVPPEMLELWRRLLREAERGCNADVLIESDEFARTVESLSSTGLSGFKDASGVHGPERLLRLNYVRLQYERLFGEVPLEAVGQ